MGLIGCDTVTRLTEQSAPDTSDDPVLFSILVTAYNRPEYLREALESVRQQTVSDFECIVVDDASPTPLSVPADPRFRLVRRDVNGGPAASRNTGIAQARGKYVLFLDDDDRFTPERLAYALEGLQRAPLALCRSKRMDDPRTDDERAAKPEKLLEGDVSDTIRETVTHSLGQVAIERSKLLPFDERFVGGQDTEWWIRTAQQVHVTTVPEIGHLFRAHSGVRHGNDMTSRLESHKLMMEIHADYFAQHPRASAFHYRRMGITAIKASSNRDAARLLWRSLCIRPSATTAWHLLRAITGSMPRRRAARQRV
jgi:glycosyltransferase involved in cell wall biosynthesis